MEDEIDAAHSNRLQELKASRSAKLGVLTRRKNEIFDLMKHTCQVEIVKSKVENEFNKAYQELNDVNDCVKTLLSVTSEDDVKLDQSEWYIPKIIPVDEFKDGVIQWIDQNEKVTANDATMNTTITVDDIAPKDSVSNVRSRRSSKSARSSIASLKMQLESEQAELAVKAEGLKRKQQLEIKEAELQAEKEKLEMETQMAANKAKLSIIKEYELSHELTQIVPKETHQSDGMNEYLEGYIQEETEQQPEKLSWTAGLDSTNMDDVPTRTRPTHKEPVERATHGTMTEYESVRKKMPSQPTYQRHQEYDPLTSVYATHTINPPLGGTKVQAMSYENTSSFRPYDLSAFPGTHHFMPHGTDARGHVRPSTQPHSKGPTTNTQDTSKKHEFYSLVNLMEGQNRITETLIKQQGQFTLPSITIPVFKGDPLEYQFFIRAFEHGIERKTENRQDMLYFLEQFTSGQPRELVRSCQYMLPDRGYTTAKELLKKHFGNEHKIATSYLDKVLSWPIIKAEDAEALQAYSVFLNGCLNAMSSVEYLEELNHPTNMRAILSKLAYKTQERWRFKACELQDRYGTRPKFPELVEFINYQSRILSHPLFGSLNPTQTRRAVISPPGKPFPSKDRRPKSAFSGFATNVAKVTGSFYKQAVTECVDKAPRKTTNECLQCKGNHELSSCSQLKKKTHEEKLEFLKKKGVCFGCFEVGHMSKGCQKRLTCQVCSLKHPTILHINRKYPNTEKDENSKDTAVTVYTNQAEVWSETGAGKSECKLAIVPVKIKMKKSDKVILTYAFMDPGSSATFCTESLLRQLQATGSRTTILLRTMNEEQVIKTSMVNGMEISALDSNEYLELPEVYSHSAIPVKAENIPDQEDIKQWPYLHQVKLPRIKAEIGLLIGNNVPKALEPWMIINSQGKGPFAVKTTLGWTVNGPLTQGTGNVITTNRISLVRIEELLQQQMKYDFPERQHEERLEMSQEDHIFMGKVSNSVKLQDGHYNIGLPLRTDEAEFPNNRCLAEQRVMSLKRKLLKNPQFHEEYRTLMADNLKRGFAIQTTSDNKQKEAKVGKTWYIPHHGVYHPKKHKLRVVFDCGATYQGVSLNSQLLQGPDLTSNLTGVLTRFRQRAVAFITDVEAMFHQVRVPDEDSVVARWKAGHGPRGV